MDEVSPRVFISDLKSANDGTLLRKNNIKCIISLGCSVEISVYDEACIDRALCLQFPLLLDAPEEIIVDVLLFAAAHIQRVLSPSNSFGNSSGSVLVHCVYGQSRSASVIMWHMISSRMLPFFIKVLSVSVVNTPATNTKILYLL